MLAVHASGGTFLALIILFGSCQDEALLARRRFGTYGYTFLTVIYLPERKREAISRPIITLFSASS